jgi:hypothetical protein
MNSKLFGLQDYRVITGLSRDPLYRNSLFMAFSNIFNAGCGFFFWMIAARLYTVEEVGGDCPDLFSGPRSAILQARIRLLHHTLLPSEERPKYSTLATITTLASLVVSSDYIVLAEHFSPSLAF